MTGTIRLPPLPWPGTCQCGSTRYRVTAPPFGLHACHCQECQKLTASAFSMSMPMARDSLEIDWEPLGSFTRKGDSGNDLVGHFCKGCGNRIFHSIPHAPDVIVLKPGTLDDTSWLVPASQIWTRRKQPWVRLPDDALIVDGDPDDDALGDAWHSLLTRS